MGAAFAKEDATFVVKNLRNPNLKKRCRALQLVHLLDEETLRKNADAIIWSLELGGGAQGPENPEAHGVRRAAIVAAKQFTPEIIMERVSRVQAIARTATDMDHEAAMASLEILGTLQPSDLGTWGFGDSPVGGDIGSLLTYVGIRLPEKRVAVLRLVAKLDPASTRVSLMRKDIERLRDDEHTEERVRTAAAEIVFAVVPANVRSPQLPRATVAWPTLTEAARSTRCSRLLRASRRMRWRRRRPTVARRRRAT
jgi:hypothetical protein